MCIDLVGIQYIRKIHYFGRAIRDARYALVNVGGRMVHVPDLMRYASVLQQVFLLGIGIQEEIDSLMSEKGFSLKIFGNFLFSLAKCDL
uniref:Uncharacterized protein n=1 Tax=Parascaris equorum TaxID=6256 RepID=A0A914R4A6_PAREQ